MVTSMRIYLVGFLGLALVGCATKISGGGSGSGDDDDGNPTPPPSPTTVAIVVQDGAAPQANVRVIFQNADDSVIAQATTDMNGSASADMPNGGNLTVIRTFAAAT